MALGQANHIFATWPKAALLFLLLFNYDKLAPDSGPLPPGTHMPKIVTLLLIIQVYVHIASLERYLLNILGNLSKWSFQE